MKLLGRAAIGQCPGCRCEPGPDCPDTSKTKRQRRFAEESAWRREVEQELAEEIFERNART